MTDLHRWVVHYGVSLTWHPQLLEIDVIRLFRITLVAGQMGAMSAAVDVAAGLDAEELKKRMDEPTAQILLEEATAKAVSRCVFGASNLFVEDEMLFSNDRLHFVQDHPARAA